MQKIIKYPVKENTNFNTKEQSIFKELKLNDWNCEIFQWMLPKSGSGVRLRGDKDLLFISSVYELLDYGRLNKFN